MSNYMMSHLMVLNDAGSETTVGWVYLRKEKVVKGGITPYAGFASNADNQASKILHLIDLFNSGNQEMIQEAITSLINTQGFKEILWHSLFRPIAVLAGGRARLADLYPEAIQTLTGFLGKGIVGILTTLIYQAFTLPLPLNLNNPRLKLFDIYPIIMIALDDIGQEAPLPARANVLVIDPKSREPRTMMVNGVKWPRNMSDIRDIVVVTTPELEVPYAQFMLPLSFKAVTIHSYTYQQLCQRGSNDNEVIFQQTILKNQRSSIAPLRQTQILVLCIEIIDNNHLEVILMASYLDTASYLWTARHFDGQLTNGNEIIQQTYYSHYSQPSFIMLIPSCLPLFNSLATQVSMFELSNALPSPRWLDFFIKLIPTEKLRTELYLLYFLLKGQVYIGNIWQIVGEQMLESKNSWKERGTDVSWKYLCAARPLITWSSCWMMCKRLRLQQANHSSLSAAEQFTYTPLEQQTSFTVKSYLCPHCPDSPTTSTRGIQIQIPDRVLSVLLINFIIQVDAVNAKITLTYYLCLIYTQLQPIRPNKEHWYLVRLNNVSRHLQPSTQRQRTYAIANVGGEYGLEVATTPTHLHRTLCEKMRKLCADGFTCMWRTCLRLAMQRECSEYNTLHHHASKYMQFIELLPLIVPRLIVAQHLLASLQVRKSMLATLNPQLQAVAGLSQHGIGIWPTQLPHANDAPEDTSVPKRAIHEPQPAIFGDWQELIHLLGGTYYYNTNKNAYTLVNLRNYQYLQMLNDFVDASQASAKEDSWVLNLNLKLNIAVLIFWTLDDMSLIITQLANIGRILYILLRERPRKHKFLSWMANVAATVLCMLITIERIRSTSVDGIINGVEVQMFIDDFSSQTKNQITLAGVSMALDIAILAIPGLGTTAIAQTLCSCSFLLGVGCILHRHDGAALLIIISVSGSILEFLAGVSINFKPSTPLVVSCFVTISIVAWLGHGHSDIFVWKMWRTFCKYHRFGMECIGAYILASHKPHLKSGPKG
ncbi:uncharacterized protein BJ212DRAFT_1303894 [Suillus subaureus]|uniref:Uncharacterized protein n=1 Tax=Suillus subaureus TaxID=48587 RepID=A0A9P7J6Z7_9AGAM|nr:uncharacterized protein BJ212DRAFT_1303894 [Suillus subaureus]KAG1805829.1 hypothetical protein BJ212DRAFT_1303894 [Suillus subaureus]